MDHQVRIMTETKAGTEVRTRVRIETTRKQRRCLLPRLISTLAPDIDFGPSLYLCIRGFSDLDISVGHSKVGRHRFLRTAVPVLDLISVEAGEETDLDNAW